MFMTIPSPSPEAVVIVGGGFGGLFSALAITARLPDRPVVLIEPQEHFHFQPLLYELLSGELQPWEVAPTYRELLSSRGICWIQDRVTTINLAGQELTTASADRLTWSDLVLATGTEPNDFGIPGVREHAFGFRNLKDVTHLRERVQDLRQQHEKDAALVIVGAGPTGCELACKLADLLGGSARIHLVERGPGILPRSTAFNRERATAALERRQVCLHLDTAVSRVDKDRVSFNDGSSLRHHGLIWSAGSRPSLPRTEPPQTKPGEALSIAADLRVLGQEHVYALGDCARYGDDPWPATAQVAMQQGDAIAAALSAVGQGQDPEPFQFQDLGEMLSLGVGDATLTGLGITLAGPLAFRIRRATYLTRMPGLSLGLRSAGAWLLNR